MSGIVGGINGAQLDHLAVNRSDFEPELMALSIGVGLRDADLHPLPTAQNVCDEGSVGRRFFGSGQWWKVLGHTTTLGDSPKGAKTVSLPIHHENLILVNSVFTPGFAPPFPVSAHGLRLWISGGANRPELFGDRNPG